MKVFLRVLIVSILFASVLGGSSVGIIDLSTLNKPALQPVMLPQVSPTMPAIPPTALGGKTNLKVMDLSTLGKKSLKPMTTATVIKAATPITVTPTISIKNMNITSVANTVYTPPLAISSNATVITPPIAIFGGA